MKKYTIIAVTAVMLVITLSPLNSTSLPINNYHYYRPENGLSAAVAATGGINLTNVSFTNTSYYNPSLLAFRTKSTVSSTIRSYSEKETDLNDYGLPANSSYRWNSSSMAYIGIEAQNVSFNYLNLSRLNYESGTAEKDRNYVDYNLDGYRFSYGSASDNIAFGINATLLSGRVVHIKESIENDVYAPVVFADDQATGYSFDFGAVIKSDYLAYGLFIPNVLSKVYWRDSNNTSLQTRLHTAFQYGSDESFVMTGYSRKFDLKSKSTYHIGFQQNIRMGTIGGEYYTVPLRLGAYSDDSFWKLNKANFSFGSGLRYSYFDIDFSFTTTNLKWDNYFVMGTISVSVDQ